VTAPEPTSTATPLVLIRLPPIVRLLHATAVVQVTVRLLPITTSSADVGGAVPPQVYYTSQ
jgi:hypothetical protein